MSTVAGVLALTTGVALAETSPADPEVVEPIVDEPDVADPVDVAESVDAVEEPVADERPQNHGYFVSQAAHDRSGEGGNHGASVSAVARSDAGKPGRG